MKTLHRLGNLPVLVLALFISVATTTATVQPVAGVDEDTVTAVNLLFHEGMTAPEVTQLLGSPSRVTKIDNRNYTVAYEGVRYKLTRHSFKSVDLVRIKAGDFYPGSATVTFTYVNNKVSKIAIE